jgi:choline monooxygenase
MTRSVEEIVDEYRADTPLAHASTIPSAWYIDPRILDLERRTVFSSSWQVVARIDLLRRPGDFASFESAGGEPIVVVRGHDDEVRGFYNVCRHHAAAVVTEPQGSLPHLRCPYHGWTYSLEGELKGTPDFSGVCDFDRRGNGLVPIDIGMWEHWIFARPDAAGLALPEFLTASLTRQVADLGLGALTWMERRAYTVDCNWKVFVDNYLDGGYHVPHLHKGLDSVLDYGSYMIEPGERFCLQWSPMAATGRSPATEAVRQGDRARYYWIYPNFMINCYDEAMDTNLVIPRGVDKTEVIFDFYFRDVSDRAVPGNRASIEVSQQIQDEDVAICASVQRGLGSRAYTAGRLSVRREAGEHLFHRLLNADLKAGLAK